jgi:hypothetical protein
MLGKAPLCLIYCLSARMARQESHPTSGHSPPLALPFTVLNTTRLSESGREKIARANLFLLFSSFNLVFKRLEIGFVAEVGFDGFLSFTVSVKVLITFRGLLLHLLMTDRASMIKKWKAVRCHDLIHILLPEAHAGFLAIFGAQFGGL